MNHPSLPTAQVRRLAAVGKFFAVMLVLTLAARGLAAAGMPRVTLGQAAAGNITQSYTLSGAITTDPGAPLTVPAGLLVTAVEVSAGQRVEAGALIARFDAAELARAVAAKQAEVNQLAVAAAGQQKPETADDYALRLAQQQLERAYADSEEVWQQGEEAVAAARAARDDAQRRLAALEAAAPATPESAAAAARQEQLAAAREELAAAESALAAARDSAEAANDAALDAAQAVEDNRNTAAHNYALAAEDAAEATAAGQSEAAVTAAPLSAAQAETLRTAAAARGAAAAFWREEKGAEIKTAFPGKEPEEAFAAARTASARAVYISGGVALAFPARYVAGTAPGAGQADGCAVSTALADALFGSREAVGLALAVNGETRRVTGIFAAQEAAVLCPVTSAGGCTAVELAPAAGGARGTAAPGENETAQLRRGDGTAANPFAADPRGSARAVLQAAGLGAAAARLLPYGTLRGMLAALAWLPLAAAACLLARGLWQALPLRGGARWLAGLALALLAALALPAALAALPRWLIPARWSDVSFWSSLGETLRAALFTLTALPDTARDRALATLLLRAAACLLALPCAALLFPRRQL